MLGEGSFGKVYAVKDGSGQLYAVKLLKLWEVPSEIRDSLSARFDMEFETGRIDSDYLVHSLSHGLVLGNPYIVMEYCPNGDLLNLSQSTSINYTKAATHILYGLKALHICGKVHRDLKPENVLVKRNGNFALTDFGISGDRTKRMTERNILGKPKQIFGTYAYMPPEQLRPKKDATVLPTTDIFSFGVMMFQLLTGELPFGPLEDERDLPLYLRRGKNGEWDRDLLVDNASRREWATLIEGCLMPDYQHRLQSADEVLALVPHVRMYTDQATVDSQPFQTRIKNGVLLRIMQGEEYGRVYKLDDMIRGEKNILSMGRSDQNVFNDIPIREENSCYISRRHCTLELDYDIGSWVIRDGQWDRSNNGGWHLSTNGTYVNSKEVTANGLAFSPGDIISIGDTKLRAEAY
jgi:serine/threonine protein kinase